jgi:hypothetical protein
MPADGAIDQEIPIALGQRAKAGKDGKQHDRPGQDANPPEPVGQDAENKAADNRAYQGRGHQRGALRGRQLQVGRNHPQHESEDQKVEAIHRVTERRPPQRLARLGTFVSRRLTRDQHTDGFLYTHPTSPVCLELRNKKALHRLDRDQRPARPFFRKQLLRCQRRADD